MEEEVLALVRFSDLVDFLVEAKDANATIADLRRPVIDQISSVVSLSPTQIENLAASTSGSRVCRNGHLLADGQSKCFSKGCPFSAGYKAKKIKK